jgi:hypothetical protein
VLDLKLVPPSFIQIADDNAGRPRSFSEYGAFAIICATRLLELGLPHEANRFFLGRMREIIDHMDRYLFLLPTDTVPVVAELGREQSPGFDLSRRRWIRRLAARGWRRILALTRNPSLVRGLMAFCHHQYLAIPRRISRFLSRSPPKRSDYAW